MIPAASDPFLHDVPRPRFCALLWAGGFAALFLGFVVAGVAVVLRGLGAI